MARLLRLARAPRVCVFGGDAGWWEEGDEGRVVPAWYRASVVLRQVAPGLLLLLPLAKPPLHLLLRAGGWAWLGMVPCWRWRWASFPSW